MSRKQRQSDEERAAFLLAELEQAEACVKRLLERIELADRLADAASKMPHHYTSVPHYDRPTEERTVLRLTLERKRRGWSQAKLAREAEMCATDLSRLEGKKIVPYPSWKARLGAALGIAPDELFQEVDEPADRLVLHYDRPGEPCPCDLCRENREFSGAIKAYRESAAVVTP